MDKENKDIHEYVIQLHLLLQQQDIDEYELH
jgi:hypothetical protein